MSWDVMVFSFREKPASLEELDESQMLPLGSPAEVNARVAKHLKDVDWSNPTWGQYRGKGFSFELNVGSEDPVSSMMIHVRGGGDAVTELFAIAIPNGWTLFDTSSGEFLDPKKPGDASWEAFQKYRDRVLGK